MESTKDKRVKREIANSNERRRMQSINAGFQKLKRLLPVNSEEKLSKAAILQQASEFIQQIERDKTLLHEQNTLLRTTLIEVKGGFTAPESLDLDALPVIPITTHIAMNTIATTTTNTTNTTTSTTTTSTTATTPTLVGNSGNNSGCSSNSSNSSDGSNHYCSNSSNNNNNFGNKEPTISDRVSSPNGFAKAAIALPLEVPYTPPHDLHPPPLKLQKTSTQEPAPKAQNLDTICKAIMEIEGDCVFTTENVKNETT